MIATILEILGFTLILGAIAIASMPSLPLMSNDSTALAICGATLVMYGLARRVIKILKNYD